MKLSILFTLAASTCEFAVATSTPLNTDSKGSVATVARGLSNDANDAVITVLNSLRAAQNEIHAQKQVIANLTAVRPDSTSTVVDNDLLHGEVATAFENMIGSIHNATRNINNHNRIVVKRQFKEISIPEVYGEITDIIQAIVSDIVSSLVSVTNLFNDSHFAQQISQLLIQALLGLINVLGHVLRALPGIEKFLAFVNQVLQAIPI